MVKTKSVQKGGYWYMRYLGNNPASRMMAFNLCRTNPGGFPPPHCVWMEPGYGKKRKSKKSKRTNKKSKRPKKQSKRSKKQTKK